MGQLRNEDIAWCVRRLPPVVVQLAQWHAAIVAGGFLRSVISGEEVNDVDIFASSTDAAAAMEHALCKFTGLAAIRTPNALTFPGTIPTVQIITRWLFPTLEECIESFDFTIARAGMQIVNGAWTSYCDDDFYPDLAAKRLRYSAPYRREDEAGSVLRLLKFYRKGYRAPLIDIACVLARAVKGMDGGDFDDEQVRRDFILKRLRVVDPAVDPEEEGHLG